MDLKVLGCPDHDLTISGKSLPICLCVCDKNFVATVAQELMNNVLWSFLFRVTIIKICVYQLLKYIAERVAL